MFIDELFPKHPLYVPLLPRGAQVVIGGTGLRDDTGGGCVDVTRGNVAITGLTCSAPPRTGVNVTLRNSEGGVSLSSLAIEITANFRCQWVFGGT